MARHSYASWHSDCRQYSLGSYHGRQPGLFSTQLATINRARRPPPALQVIQDINLDIASHEFVVMVGPSGCGKSTLLRIIAGLEDVSTGSITIDNRDVTGLEPTDRGISMVFQSYALYPHMTVAENMTFGLRVAKVPKAEIDRRLQSAAQTLQLAPYRDRRPAQLHVTRRPKPGDLFLQRYNLGQIGPHLPVPETLPPGLSSTSSSSSATRSPPDRGRVQAAPSQYPGWLASSVISPALPPLAPAKVSARGV